MMMSAENFFDLALMVALIAAAWRALFGKDPFESTVFFIAYGLLMAMAWIRLGAPDVALSEACVGAGLTGALLLGGIRQFEKDDLMRQRHTFKWSGLFLMLLTSSLSFFMALVLWNMRDTGPNIIPQVLENIDRSGSSHPVTAVLLNFRGFDTWLELGVLLLAVIAAIVVRAGREERLLAASPEVTVDFSTTTLARIMLPLLLLIGGIMLWYGSRAPGGAFQAGALIGAAGILLQLAGQRNMLHLKPYLFRIFLVMGFFTFLSVALGTLFTKHNLFEFPPEWAGSILLFIEIGATLSIALTLNVMFACNDRRKEGFNL